MYSPTRKGLYMAKEKVGKVSVTPKGEWASGTTYEALDIVRYGGNSWLARQETSIEPIEGESWQRITELTSDGIKAALGYTPERLSKYVLIETIVVGDESIKIERTQEPDGTPYAFDGLLILAKCPVGKTAALFSGTSYTNKNRSESIWSATGSTYSNIRYAHSVWENWNGKWRRGRSTTWYADDEFVQDGVLYARALTAAVKDGEYINRFSFSAGAGLIFYIYARRKGA